MNHRKFLDIKNNQNLKKRVRPFINSLNSSKYESVRIKTETNW
jgi:hypothetical protein